MPLQVTHLPDDSGRMLIVDKTGRMHISDPEAPGRFSSEVYMHMPDCFSEDETGLLSVVFSSPAEWANGDQFIYAYWGAKGRPGQADGMRISKFQHSEREGGLDSRALYGTEQVLWIDADGFPEVVDFQYRGGNTVLWHYGGQLSIGPDGHLYLGVGDKYLSHMVENPTSVAGCIIRIGTDGTIPDGNLPPSIKPAECWSYGLRNPYRASWSDDGRYFIAEVGGNNHDTAWEDVHLGGAGKHYGWPHCEGHPDSDDARENFPSCDPSIHDDPIMSYKHNGKTASIIGGFVSDGQAGAHLPDQYRNAYFYTDFLSKSVMYFDIDRPNVNARAFMKAGGSVASMSIAPNGDIWMIESPERHWVIKRLRYEVGQVNADAITSIDIHSDTTAGLPPFDVQFAAAITTLSGAAATSDVQYEWNFGDGSPALITQELAISHTFTHGGEFHAQVVARENQFSVQSPFTIITSGTPPTITITSDLAPALFVGHQTVDVTAVATDSDGTDLTDTITWSVYFLHEDHLHPYEGGAVGGAMAMEIPSSGHSFEGHTGFLFVATIVNQFGLRSVAEQMQHPAKTTLIVATEPAGGQVHVDDGLVTTPNTVDSMVGFSHSLRAKEFITIGASAYIFDHWSDGSTDPTHIFPSQLGGVAITAIYRQPDATTQSALTCANLGREPNKWQDDQTACCTSDDLQGNCFDRSATFARAEEICTNGGGRLCSAEELQDDTCRGSGCSLDRSHVWTRTPCGAGFHYANGGSTKYRGDDPRVCLPDDSTDADVRCCADVILRDLGTARPTPAPTSAAPTTPEPTTGGPTSAPTPAPATSLPTPAPTPLPTTGEPTSVPTLDGWTPPPSTEAPTSQPTPAPATSVPSPSPTSAPATTEPTPAPTAMQSAGSILPRDVSAVTCTDLDWELRDGSSAVCIVRKIQDGHCMSGQVTFQEAQGLCEAVGAKLCSIEEVASDEGRSAGCGLNKQAVWTRDACTGGYFSTGATSRARMADECVTNPTAVRDVQCCADKILQPQPAGQPSEEADPATAAPTPSPTVEVETEVEPPVVEQPVVTSTAATPPAEPETEPTTEPVTELMTVAVVATEALPRLPVTQSAMSCGQLGWSTHRRSSITDVCGATPTTSDGVCPGEVNFVVAMQVCESLGARLCTPAELTGDVARKSGCALDRQPIWTSQACAQGRTMVGGSSKIDANARCGDTPADNTDLALADARGYAVASMRCCADA